MDFHLWLDLETTGGIDGIEGHEILEVAIGITAADATLRVVSQVESWLTDVPPRGDGSRDLDPIVRKMHTKSGLLDALDAGPCYPIEHIEAVILSSMFDVATSHIGEHKFILAGSGVSRFDRAFLKRDMPILNGALEYYELDISTVRRALQAYGLNAWVPQASPYGSWAIGKHHRAADDVADHISSAQAMFGHILDAARATGVIE